MSVEQPSVAASTHQTWSSKGLGSVEDHYSKLKRRASDNSLQSSGDSKDGSHSPPRAGSIIAWGVRASSQGSGSSSQSVSSSVRWRVPSISVGDKQVTLFPPQRSTTGELSPTRVDRQSSFADDTKVLSWSPGAAGSSYVMDDRRGSNASDAITPPRTTSPVSEHAESSLTGSSSPYFSASASAASQPRLRSSARFTTLAHTFPSPVTSGRHTPLTTPRMDMVSPRQAAASSEGLVTATIAERRKGRFLAYDMSEFGALPSASVEDLDKTVAANNVYSQFGGSLANLASPTAATTNKADRRRSVGPLAPALFSIGEGYAGGVQRDEKGKLINVAKWQKVDPLNKGTTEQKSPTGLKSLKKRFSASVADLFSPVASSAKKSEGSPTSPRFWRTASGLFGKDANKQASTVDLSIPWETPAPNAKSASRSSLRLRPSEHSPVPQRLSPRQSSIALRRESRSISGPPAAAKNNSIPKYTRHMSTPDLRLQAEQILPEGSPAVCPRVLQWVSTTQGIGAKPEMSPLEPLPQGVDLGFRRGSIAPSYQYTLSAAPVPVLEGSEGVPEKVETQTIDDIVEPSPVIDRNTRQSVSTSISTLASVFTASNSRSTAPSSPGTVMTDPHEHPTKPVAQPIAVSIEKPVSKQAAASTISFSKADGKPKNRRWSSGFFGKLGRKSNTPAPEVPVQAPQPPSILIHRASVTAQATPAVPSVLSPLMECGESIMDVPIHREAQLPLSHFNLTLDFGSTDFLTDDVMKAMERRNSIAGSFMSDISGPASSNGDTMSDAVIEQVVAVPAPFYTLATASRGSMLHMGAQRVKA